MTDPTEAEMEAAAKAYWTPERIAAAIARGKREILADVRKGTVPHDVATFADLHDYVDANEYGGLCDDDAVNPVYIGNVIQNALAAWIEGGGIEADADWTTRRDD